MKLCCKAVEIEIRRRWLNFHWNTFSKKVGAAVGAKLMNFFRLIDRGKRLENWCRRPWKKWRANSLATFEEENSVSAEWKSMLASRMLLVRSSQRCWTHLVSLITVKSIRATLMYSRRALCTRNRLGNSGNIVDTGVRVSLSELAGKFSFYRPSFAFARVGRTNRWIFDTILCTEVAEAMLISERKETSRER